MIVSNINTTFTSEQLIQQYVLTKIEEMQRELHENHKEPCMVIDVDFFQDVNKQIRRNLNMFMKSQDIHVHKGVNCKLIERMTEFNGDIIPYSRLLDVRVDLAAEDKQ